MISRRHIRIKVMQSVYALQTQKSDNLATEESFIRHSIDKSFELFAAEIQLLVELQKLAEKLYQVSLNNHEKLKTGSKPNATFVNNKLIQVFKESSSLSTFIEENNVTLWEYHDEYVRIIYDLMLEWDEYKKYLLLSNPSFGEDQKFIKKLFTEIIAPNDKLGEFYEDTFMGWSDDLPFVNSWTLKVIKDLKENDRFILPRLYKNTEDEEFAVQLFRKVVLNANSFEEEIVKKTPNWDIERIAEMDVILISMGIAEFLEFPSIPVRVSMNEYIEIAKDYSTEKSGYFINGVLDKIQKDFSEAKRLQKSGRGLQ